MLTTERKSALCQACGDCCSFFVLNVYKPPTFEEQKRWKDWMEARGIIVIREGKSWYRVRINHPCPHLTAVEDLSARPVILGPSGKRVSINPKTRYGCDIYEKRCEICSSFDGRLEDPRDNLHCLWKEEEGK